MVVWWWNGGAVHGIHVCCGVAFMWVYTTHSVPIDSDRQCTV